MKTAAVPSIVTLVAPGKVCPQDSYGCAHLAGSRPCIYNGPSPTDRLKTVPQPNSQALLEPPAKVAP